MGRLEPISDTWGPHARQHFARGSLKVRHHPQQDPTHSLQALGLPKVALRKSSQGPPPTHTHTHAHTVSNWLVWRNTAKHIASKVKCNWMPVLHWCFTNFAGLGPVV